MLYLFHSTSCKVCIESNIKKYYSLFNEKYFVGLCYIFYLFNIRIRFPNRFPDLNLENY